MKAEITEFSYGYTVIEAIKLQTNWYESIGISPIFIPDTNLYMTNAPFLPSLIEEGQKLGYDVKLTFDYLTLFLQFKISDYMLKNTAKEVTQNLMSLPFYRFYIRPPIEKRPRQHNMLCELEVKELFVYYAAPKFHNVSQFNTYYLNRSILENSFFIRPTAIGTFLDNDGGHTVAFKDGADVCILSKPRILNIDPQKSHELFFNDIKHQLGIKANRSYNHIIDQLLQVIGKYTSKKLIDDTNNYIQSRVSHFKYQPEQEMFTIAYLSRNFLGCAVLFIPLTQNSTKNDLQLV